MTAANLTFQGDRVDAEIEDNRGCAAASGATPRTRPPKSLSPPGASRAAVRAYSRSA
jgi:hypothetical protein